MFIYIKTTIQEENIKSTNSVRRKEKEINDNPDIADQAGARLPEWNTGCLYNRHEAGNGEVAKSTKLSMKNIQINKEINDCRQLYSALCSDIQSNLLKRLFEFYKCLLMTVNKFRDNALNCAFICSLVTHSKNKRFTAFYERLIRRSSSAYP